MFADRVAVVTLHTLCEVADASAVLGTSKLVISTVSVSAAQLPLTTDQTNSVVLPAVTPVTVVFLSVGVVIDPGPEILDHIPAPTAGLFPSNVNVELLHCS